MDQKLKTACVQLSSGPDIEENLAVIADMVRQAAGQGARFIATPENSCHMKFPQEAKLRSSPAEADHKAITLFSELARELEVWLLAGSLSIKVGADKIANRSFLFDANGDIVARYDKIHLFDVDLAGGESYRESAVVRAGDKTVTAESPWGTIGLTICYDLRFAYLFRKLAQAGASIITVPAAFTVPTGQAHWEVLLRARAIETGSFIVAPGQCGTHDGGRATYGHSLIVGPWGDILAQGGNEPCVITAELNMADVIKARQAIPALKHDRAV